MDSRRITRSQTGSTNKLSSKYDIGRGPPSSINVDSDWRAAATNVKAEAKSTPLSFVSETSPFPDWPRPTPDDCEEVNSILSRVHGDLDTAHRRKPAPAVLDAVIQTLLSTSTSNANSSRAMQGLREKFGERGGGGNDGVTVDWSKVHTAAVDDVLDAIRQGGLAGVKSKNIKKILEMVYMENLERESNSSGRKHAPSPPSSSLKEDATDVYYNSIVKQQNRLLSLDHLHSLPTETAMDELLKYPGIGPKAAACVVLFVLDRPVFAVDTHIFRLSRWLNWVPPPNRVANSAVNEKTAFAHLDARIPDRLKLSLHLLLVRHGQECGRCRAATRESSKEWDNGCAIEHHVERENKNKNIHNNKNKTKRRRVS